MIVNGLSKGEMVRILNCQGCRHLQLTGGGKIGMCAYILNMGRRRPCKFGDPECSVKEVDSSLKDIENIKNKTLESVKNKPKTRGPKWDVETAKRLRTENKMGFKEISQIIGVNAATIMSYAEQHGWSGGRMVNGKLQRRRFIKRNDFY